MEEEENYDVLELNLLDPPPPLMSLGWRGGDAVRQIAAVEALQLQRCAVRITKIITIAKMR